MQVNKFYASDEITNWPEVNMRPILLIGMVDSPHFNKWVHTVKQEFPEQRIIIFPSDRPRVSYPRNLSSGIAQTRKFKTFKLVPFRKLNFDVFDFF